MEETLDATKDTKDIKVEPLTTANSISDAIQLFTKGCARVHTIPTSMRPIVLPSVPYRNTRESRKYIGVTDVVLYESDTISCAGCQKACAPGEVSKVLLNPYAYKKHMLVCTACRDIALQ